MIKEKATVLVVTFRDYFANRPSTHLLFQRKKLHSEWTKFEYEKEKKIQRNEDREKE